MIAVTQTNRITIEQEPAQPAKRKNARRRRGRGEGSIFERADGRWAATLSLGIGANGKRQRRTVYGETKKEVQEQLAKLQSSNAAGTLVNLDRVSLGDHLDRWLADVAKPKVRATTFVNYQRVVTKHIKPHIGGSQLQKLNPAHVQGLLGKLDRNGVGPNPRRLAYAVLSLALKCALKQGLVARNVCEAVDPPAIGKATIQPLDKAGVGALLAAAKGDRLEALYHLAIGSGMREGEIFGLQWDALDLAAGTVSVKQSLAEINGKLVIGDAKSASSRRMIDLPAHAVEALEKHRKKMLADGYAGVEFVFCNKSGGPLRRSHFHHDEFKPLLAKAGLPSMRFHDLRHTHATLCLLAGENPKVVQERLGHANIGITLDTYSHVLPSMKTGAAAKVDAIVTAALAENANGCQMAVKAG